MGKYENYTIEELKKEFNNNSGWLLLKDIPEHMKTKGICELAVSKRGLSLQFVPEHMKTEEMCKLAIAENGLALEDVPENLKTEKLCEKAVAKTGVALKFVPEHMKSKDICKTAIIVNKNSLLYVPLNIIANEEICKIIKENKLNVYLSYEQEKVYKKSRNKKVSIQDKVAEKKKIVNENKNNKAIKC